MATGPVHGYLRGVETGAGSDMITAGWGAAAASWSGVLKLRFLLLPVWLFHFSFFAWY